MKGKLPLYDELPVGPRGGRLGWKVFGEKDQRGTLNLLTPERTLAAKALVKRGESFPLDHPPDFFSVPLVPGRRPLGHHLVEAAAGMAMDDYYDDYFPQASSQWDSLAHFAYGPDEYYNGTTLQEIKEEGRNTIRSFAKNGIVGRGILLDMPDFFAAASIEYSPDESFGITAEHMMLATERQGIVRQEGDIVLLYTGFDEWYGNLTENQRREFAGKRTISGLARCEETVRYLWNSRIAAIASDNLAVERSPADFRPEAMPFGFMHQVMIGSLGFALGELWNLSHLVEDCRSTGVYEGLLVSTPNGPQIGIGSPANAIFLK